MLTANYRLLGLNYGELGFDADGGADLERRLRSASPARTHALRADRAALLGDQDTAHSKSESAAMASALVLALTPPSATPEGAGCESRSESSRRDVVAPA